jgi:hypothetical protein
MRQAFGVSVLTFLLLFGLILALRYRTACLEDRTSAAVERLAADGG